MIPTRSLSSTSITCIRSLSDGYGWFPGMQKTRATNLKVDKTCACLGNITIQMIFIFPPGQSNRAYRRSDGSLQVNLVYDHLSVLQSEISSSLERQKIFLIESHLRSDDERHSARLAHSVLIDARQSLHPPSISIQSSKYYIIMFKKVSKRKDLARLLSLQSNSTLIRCATMSRLVSTVADLPFDLKDKTLFQTGAFIGNEWISKAKSGKTYNVRVIPVSLSLEHASCFGDSLRFGVYSLLTLCPFCIQVQNPATGETIAKVVECGVQETQRAIEEAEQAFKSWSTRTAKSRAAILTQWHQEILRAREDITRIMTLECGKPLAEARNEFDSGVESISWFAEEAKRINGDIIETPADDKQFFVLKQPVGVVGAITPWNFPFSMITRKVSPALAAGCTVCLKPAELTPLTAFALAELGKRAGIPRGVFNVVSGDAESIGKAFTDSNVVRKIAFTGSTRVGKLLYAASANTMKHVSLELGGNAPYIVFDDADIQSAARDVVISSYRNAGQTCICTNRVFVHEDIYDAFNDALVKHVTKLRLGDGLQPGVTHGPLISSTAVEQVDFKVQDAVRNGGKVLVGGRKPSFDESSRRLGAGFFYEPTVIVNATKNMKVFKEEIFGPITPVFKFNSDAEVVKLANDTEYGLAAYFYTQNLSRAWRVAKALEYGMIGINQVAITSEVAPFGGWKHSGLGREHSKYGLDEYLDKKTLCMGLEKIDM